MTFSIIGTGNIAWFFGKRMAAAGHSCIGVYGRDDTALHELKDAVLAKEVGTTNGANDEADICFLAVSDTSLAEVAHQLNFKNTVLVHMAGAMPMDVLNKSAKDYAVLWPVYSISRSNLPRHRDIPCAWEANSDRAKRFVREMARAFSDNLFEANYDKRRWLHLSAVVTNNFINHLLAVNEKICTENDLPLTLLQPLIDQTFERAKNTSPLLTQTGPAIRHDDNTIQQHLKLLSKEDHLKKMYEALTVSIQAMHAKA